MSLRNSIVKLVQDTLCRGKALPVGDSESLLDAGVIDSLGMMELVKAIDKHFHITVEDEELSPDNLDSIDALTAYLKSKGVNE
ncbi:MAG: acyl carrier protein [Bryobacterales bacterium]|nr:acyl carrier protein [Bryobacterales bacterium]